VPDRGEKHDQVVDRAAEYAADQDPERARQVAELRRQDRSEQRAGRGDGREMVPEEHELVGLHIVVAVGHLHRRGLPFRVHSQHRPGQEEPVEAVGEGEDAQGHENQGDRIHGGASFAAAGDMLSMPPRTVKRRRP